MINVAGHRLGTREIEEAVQAHPGIAEVAVVGVADPLKGQIPVAFAVVKDPARVATPEGVATMRKEVMDTVDRELGRHRAARRRALRHVLPKTRSGKLLRRSIQALAEGRDPGDLTTIEDPAALEQIRAALAAPLGRCRAARGAARRAVAAPIGDNARRSRRPTAVTACPHPAAATPRSPPLDARRRRRRASTTARSPSSTADGRLLSAPGDPHVADDDAQRAEAVPGAAVRRRGRRRALRLLGAQVALLCASHSGEPRHVEAVADMLASAGSAADDLQCGTHAPGFYEVRGEVPPPPPYSPLAHNCSGKHSGMLAYCVHCGCRKATTSPRPPAAGGDPARGRATSPARRADAWSSGIDGCSAPNYAVPLVRAWRWPSRGSPRRATTPTYGRAPRGWPTR